LGIKFDHANIVFFHFLAPLQIQSNVMDARAGGRTGGQKSHVMRPIKRPQEQLKGDHPLLFPIRSDTNVSSHCHCTEL